MSKYFHSITTYYPKFSLKNHIEWKIYWYLIDQKTDISMILYIRHQQKLSNFFLNDIYKKIIE